MELRDKIRALRSESGKSLQQVADGIGVSKAHIWELETGRSRNPSLEILQKMASYFGVTIAYLVDQVPSPEAKAEHFFRRNAKMIEELSKEDLAYLESLVERLTGKK